MQPEPNNKRESEIRTMLFGLNLKLPVYMELREKFDEEIRKMQREINALNAQLAPPASVRESLLVHNRRGRPPKALIEAAGAPAQSKQKPAWSEERRKAQGEAMRKRWASYSPRERKAYVKKVIAATLAGQKHMTPEQRAAIARDGWATRRANA